MSAVERGEARGSQTWRVLTHCRSPPGSSPVAASDMTTRPEVALHGSTFRLGQKPSQSGCGRRSPRVVDVFERGHDRKRQVRASAADTRKQYDGLVVRHSSQGLDHTVRRPFDQISLQVCPRLRSPHPSKCACGGGRHFAIGIAKHRDQTCRHFVARTDAGAGKRPNRGIKSRRSARATSFGKMRPSCEATAIATTKVGPWTILLTTNWTTARDASGPPMTPSASSAAACSGISAFIP